MSINQVEFNIQVSAAIEKTGKEINKTKAALASAGSAIDTAHMTIGDIGQLMLASGYGYNAFVKNDSSLSVPSDALKDISPNATGIHVCDEQATPVSQLSKAFVMTYDSRQKEIVTCYLGKVYGEPNQTAMDSVMLYYRGTFNEDKTAVENTSLWIISKDKNNQGLSYPQWRYVYAAKTAFFPFGPMDKAQGIYGPYDASDASYGQWGLNGKRTIAQMLKEMQAQSLMASEQQTFTPDEIQLLWSNIHIGEVDLEFVDIFNHTLSTGQTPYIQQHTV